MNKKGQITIFVIIAVLLVTSIGAYFIFKNYSGADSSFGKVSQSAVPPQIKTAVEECFRSNLEDSIYAIGSMGGYLILPENFIDKGLLGISYGIYEGEDILNSLENMEREINLYVEDFVPRCLDEIDLTEEIIVGEVEVDTQINSREILSLLNIPITIKSEDESVILESEYDEKLHVELGESYNTAKKVIRNKLENPEMIDLKYLSEQEQIVDVLSLEEDLVYSIVNGPTEDFPSYVFNFGVDI